jgi:hypothetical protein
MIGSASIAPARFHPTGQAAVTGGSRAMAAGLSSFLFLLREAGEPMATPAMANLIADDSGAPSGRSESPAPFPSAGLVPWARQNIPARACRRDPATGRRHPHKRNEANHD